jgi:hypothetical protein
MTCYTTCAYFGCDNQVAYNPGKDFQRSRYCPEHEHLMRDRVSKCSDKDINHTLKIEVKRNVRRETSIPGSTTKGSSSERTRGTIPRSAEEKS